MKASIEIVRRVYDDEEGAFIQVNPDPNTQSWVEIKTADDDGEKNWGKIRFVVSPIFARALAAAIIATADELEKGGA